MVIGKITSYLALGLVGAAGTTDILAQVTPIYVSTEAERFRTELG